MKKWKIWETMREKVEQFRQTMPLIQDLKNPALRQRHWDALRSEVRATDTLLVYFICVINTFPYPWQIVSYALHGDLRCFSGID